VNPLTLRTAPANGKKRFHLELGLFSSNPLFDKEFEHESSFVLSGVVIENPAEGTGVKFFTYIKHQHHRVLNDL
jgi:hypothetical protein